MIFFQRGYCGEKQSSLRIGLQAIIAKHGKNNHALSMSWHIKFGMIISLNNE